jgi:hypothetical protein
MRLTVIIVICLLYVSKGLRVESLGEGSEEAHKSKGNRHVQMALENFRALKTVSRAFVYSVRIFICYSRRMKIRSRYSILPNSLTLLSSRRTLSFGTYARSSPTTCQKPFFLPLKLRTSLPLLSSKRALVVPNPRCSSPNFCGCTGGLPG